MKRRGLTAAVAAATTVGILVLSAVLANAITPAGAAERPATIKGPGAPLMVTAVGVDTALDVSWTAPMSTGGSPIVNYLVAAKSGGVARRCRTNTTSCTIIGLTNGTTYSITARARTAAGWGQPSAAVSATPSTNQDCAFFGPYANLQGCSLTNIHMLNADLSHANLSNANLSNANLSFANLSDADLGSASLETTNLSQADLVGAKLVGAFLGFANLSGAALSGASVTGVTWIATVCPDGTNSDNDGGTCVGHGI